MTKNDTGFIPRLVATDIDGTIVPFMGTVSDRTRSVFHRVAGLGIEIILVTGRPPRWLPPVVDAVDVSTTAICANGAVIVNTANSEFVDVSAIPRDVASAGIAAIKKVIPNTVFAAETLTGLRTGPGYEPGRSRSRRIEGLAPNERLVTSASSIEEMLGGSEIFKVAVVSAGADPDHLLDVARAEVGDALHVTRSTAGQPLVELGPFGVTKASTLAAHAASHGIEAEDVVAFGDMPNDAKMLRWAGRGYAMAGAHPETLAAARYAAPAAADDGVAHVLESMLPVGEAA